MGFIANIKCKVFLHHKLVATGMDDYADLNLSGTPTAHFDSQTLVTEETNFKVAAAGHMFHFYCRTLKLPPFFTQEKKKKKKAWQSTSNF